MTRLLRPNIEMIGPRAELLRQLRQFFDGRGFLEVQPPCLSRDCVIDPHIDPIAVATEQFRLGIQLPPTFYLQTSPESAMKRMLCGGAPSIYSIGPVFRAGERGDQHNVEFSMLEWYQVDSDLDAGIELLGRLAIETLAADRYEVVTYRQLFRDAIGFDPIDTALATIQQRVAATDRSLSESIGDDRDGLLDAILSQLIQPALGIERPLIVKNYPLSQAALARAAPDDLQCAARFELFAGGIEIANGYDELRDADELQRRFAHCNEVRLRHGRKSFPTDTTLVQAMRDGLPPCAGVALGVDRLLMIRTGASYLADVMPFLVETA